MKCSDFKGNFKLNYNVSNTIGINLPTVNTNFPQKTVAGNYVVKLDRSTPTPATLPAAVLNDEATVTDATSDASTYRWCRSQYGTMVRLGLS
jgi:hypothetical protein